MHLLPETSCLDSQIFPPTQIFELRDTSATKTETLYSQFNKERDKAVLLFNALHGDIFHLHKDASFCWIFALIGQLTHAFVKN